MDQTVQDPENDPGKEGQQVFGVGGGGQAVLHVGYGQAVLHVGHGQAVQDPCDNPGEEGQLVLGAGDGVHAALVRGDGREVHRVGEDVYVMKDPVYLNFITMSRSETSSEQFSHFRTT